MAELTLEDYENALCAQDACNLSGVVHEFSRLCGKLWQTEEAEQLGTAWVNKHPLVKLYAMKIFDLAVGENVDFDAQLEEHYRAYRWCKEQVNRLIEVEKK